MHWCMCRCTGLWVAEVSTECALGSLNFFFVSPLGEMQIFTSLLLWALSAFAMSSNFHLSLADVVFPISEHFLENSEKLTEASGCFILCSSWQVCTTNAYDDLLPLSFLGSPLPIFNYFPQ